MGGDAGNIVASLSNNGLVLTTSASNGFTGTQEYIDIQSDGLGATTAVGAVIGSGIDFSGTNATFTLTVDSVAIDVTVTGDGSASTAATLSVIQQALDDALAAADSGNAFAAGDVVAKYDSSNRLYFETLSKKGVVTEQTFGAQASITLTSVGADKATTDLGLAAGGPYSNGRDAFGLALGNYVGYDSVASVSYQQDSDNDNNGRFAIAFDNETYVRFTTVSDNAVTALGFAVSDGSETTTVETGKDVAGSINGVTAAGSGQYLRAQSGRVTPTNGYVLGSEGADFSSAVVIDASNDSFAFKINGTQTGTITVANGSYASGDALAAALKSAINADANLNAQNYSVDVQYDETTHIFGVFSTLAGSDSTVQVPSIHAAPTNVFGLTTTTAGVNGQDASGTVDGATGLILKVEGATTGSRGSIRYISGVADQLSRLLDSLLGSSGTLASREVNLQADLDAIEQERTDLNTRLAAQEARLKAKFLYNDKIISSLNNTGSFLSQQFELLTAAVTGGQ